LKQDYDEGKEVNLRGYDPHAAAGLLKAFFRELPEPIIPTDINDQMAAIIAQQNDREISAQISTELLLDSIKMELVELLPTVPNENYVVFKTLISFLIKVSEHSAKSKMNVTNILTCLTPSLRITPGIIKFCIEDFNFFFAY